MEVHCVFIKKILVEPRYNVCKKKKNCFLVNLLLIWKKNKGKKVCFYDKYTV